MMLSEDYYGFRKKSPMRPTHRTQLSEEKLNGNKSRQKQRLDDLRLQKLKQKYNLINNSHNTANGERKQRRGREKQRERSKSKKNKFFQHETHNEMRFRYYHYNDEPAEYKNQIRRRVEKKAMESLEKDFNNRFNVIEGKSCVSQKNIKEAEDILTKKSKQLYLKESLKSAKDSDGGKNLLPHAESRPSSNSQPHRNLRRMKPEQKQPAQEQKLNKDEEDSIDFDIETQKIKLLRQKKLAYSQKQSMLLGTQTLYRKPKEVSIEPKEQIKQICNESVISINSRHDNNELKQQSMLRPEMKEEEEINTPRLATSDYDLIKELQKRARDQQSQASKEIEFNKIYPSSSSFSKSETNPNQDSQSNTLSNLIKNSSEIMMKKIDAASSQGSKYSLNKESVKDSGSHHLSLRNSSANASESTEKGGQVGDKKTDTSEKRQPVPAYSYDEFKNNEYRTYYVSPDNSALNISKGYQLQYIAYENQQYHYSNSASLKSSLQNQQIMGSGQLADNPNTNKSPNPNQKMEANPAGRGQLIQKQTQSNKNTPNSQFSSANEGNTRAKPSNINFNSISFSFDQHRNLVENHNLSLSKEEQHPTNNETGHQHITMDDSMDGNKFSFVLHSNPQQNMDNSNSNKSVSKGTTPQNVNISSFNHQSNTSSMDNINIAHQRDNTSILANSKGSEGFNQFMPVPPNIFVRPSQENLQASNNLLQAIRDLNEQEDRKICNLYSTLGYENEPLQKLMDKLYEHVACVNRIIDFVADTEIFYVDKAQREIFHVCSYLLIKRFYEERIKILQHLRMGRSCFNLINKQISEAEIALYFKTSTFNQFINDLVSSNSKIQKIIEFMYNRLHLEHSFLPPPQYRISQEDLITISEKLNEELELLIQKIDDNQQMRGGTGSSGNIKEKENSFLRDNEYEALSMRAFGLMELMFLVSALEGRNVKKLEKQIQPEDFEMYCKNNYGLFKQTILYFH